MRRGFRNSEPKIKGDRYRKIGYPRARLLRFTACFAILCIGTLLFLMIRSLSTPTFDGERAFQHLLAQYEFGPRVPGTEAHKRCLEYITRELKRSLPEVRLHAFQYESALLGLVEGTNVWASVPPAKRNPEAQALLCAHWDTRPVADKDPDPTRRALGVPGANDGASGVAVLLEVAGILGRIPPPVRVDIVLFDMEDLGGLPLGNSVQDPFCIGSNRFVRDHPEFRPDFGILLDMVGKKDLKIPKEALSRERAPQVVRKVWSMALRLGIRAFSEQMGPAVLDDHVPFLEKGIPVINLIDMDYPAWHTLQDTPERCSPNSLKQVGEVILGVIYGK